MYPKKFYEENMRIARDSAGAVVPDLMRLLSPRSVVDLGCGTGTWLAVFREQGVTDVFGVDVRRPKSVPLEIPPECFREADLTRPLRLGRRFDLALSLEVGENLPPTLADRLVDALVELAPCVLFSSAIPHQEGFEMVNEQWPEYWAAKFRERGYVALDFLRARLWANPKVAWWYAQNAVLYVRRDMERASPALREELEHPASPVAALVHPGNYLGQLGPAHYTPFRILRELRSWLQAERD